MAGIAQVYGFSNFSVSPVSVLFLPPFLLTAGDDLVVGIAIKDASITVSSVVDTQGNTYRHRVSSSNPDGVTTEIWEAQGILTTTNNQVTITLSGAAPVTAAAWEYSGVKVEAFPSPQDATSADVTSSQITAGADVSAISSWSVAVFGFQSIAATGLGVLRGIQRISVVPSAPAVGLVLLDIQAYATPSTTHPFGIAGPLGNLFESSQLAVRPWAAATLELRSATGGGPGNAGGPIPPQPPYVPPPAGTLVAWSYTYTVPVPTVFSPSSAEVTCSYFGGGCTDPTGNQGNQAY